MSSQALGANSQKCLHKKKVVYMDSSNKHFVHYVKHHSPFMAPSKREIQLIHIFMATNQSEKLE